MHETMMRIMNDVRRNVEAKPFAGSLKLAVTGEGVIHIAGGTVSGEDSPADCTISADLLTFAKLGKGELNPTYAFFRGMLKVSGDRACALQLNNLLRGPDQRSDCIARFSAGTDAAVVVDALVTNGAAIVENCASEVLADQVAAELRPHLDREGQSDQNDFNGYKTLRVYAIPARSRSAAELIANEYLLGIVDRILLPHCINYRIGSCSAIEIRPGEERQRLHRDDGIYPLQLPGVELQVSALWALSDFTAENGATHVLLGSHSGPGHSVIARMDETVQAVMPKGSLLVYLGSTFHGGGENRSSDARMALINTYALGWLRQEENHYLSIPKDIVDSYPKRMRELIGYQSHGPILGSIPDDSE